MLQVYNVKTILESVKHKFDREVYTKLEALRKAEHAERWPDGQKQQEQQQMQQQRFPWELILNKVQLIGILFCHPQSELAKKDILPRFDYYHERAGFQTDFFWAGYSGQWRKNTHPDSVPVPELSSTGWEFSSKGFNDFRNEIEENTSWRYSGQTDLILTTVAIDNDTKEYSGPTVKGMSDVVLSQHFEIARMQQAFVSDFDGVIPAFGKPV
jgi:hypothetical protein